LNKMGGAASRSEKKRPVLKEKVGDRFGAKRGEEGISSTNNI